MPHLRKLIVAALAVLCAPAVYSFQLGGFDITPTAKVEERYDDNITSAETNVKRDFSTFFSFGLEGLYDAKTESLKFKGAVNHEIFGKEDDYNNTSEDVGINYKKELSSHDLFTANNSFTHADQPRTFEDEFGRSAGRYDYYKNYFDLGLEHEFTEQFKTKIKYANQYYDPSLSTIDNSILNKPGVQADYAFSSRTIASAFYDYSNYYFDQSGTVHKHAAALGLRQYLTEQLYLDLKAGSDFIKNINDDETIRPNYLIGLFNQIDETTYAGLSFAKSFDVNYYSSDLFDNWRVVLYGGRQVSSRISVNIAGFTGGGQFAQSGIKEKFNGVNLGGGYEINKNVKATLNYTLSNRESSSSGDDYQKNTVSLGMTFKF